MIETKQIESNRKLARVSRYSVMIVAFVSLLVFLGWALDIPALRRPFPVLVAMNPLTAICFMTLSLAFFYSLRPASIVVRSVVKILSILVMLVAVLKISSNIPLDSYLFYKEVNADLFNGAPNRMAPNTAICFLVAGIALFFLNVKTKTGVLPSQFISLILFLAGLLSILGYMYGVSSFYGVIDYTPMALHTAGCFMLLSFGVLFYRPGHGFVKELTNRSAGGFSARILIPFAILVPASLGLLRIYAVRAGVVTSEFGTAMHVLAIIICFLAVIWYITVLINRRDRFRKQVQRELAESKVQLEKLNAQLEADVRAKTLEIRDIFHRVSDVFYAVDNDDRFTFVNPRAARVFGFNSEEMLGKAIWDFFPRSTISPEFISALQSARQTQQPQTMEAFSRIAGRWFMVNMYPSAAGVSLILQDITERREVEEQFKKEKAFSEAIVKSLPGIFYYYDENGKFIEWNKNFETVSGYTAEEISNMTPDQFFPDDEKEYIKARIGRVFTEGYADAEANFLSKDGTKTPYFFTGVQSEYEGKPCLTGVGFEITEQKKAQAALLHSEKKYRLLFEWNPIPMWMLSLPQLDFIDVNNAATIHYGYSRKEFIQMNAADIRSAQEAERLKGEVNKSYPDVTNAGIWRHRKKSGEEIIVEIITHDIQFDDKPVRLVLANDVTEKFNAQEAIEKYNRTLRQLTSHLQKVREEERKHIAREIHDELGQQLTVIKMDVSWIRKKTDPSNKVMLSKIEELLSLLDDTVKTVRELSSRLRPSLLDDLGLVAAIEWHLNDFRQRTGLSITVDLPEHEVNLPEEVNTALFRIMQESLTNVARHAGANHVFVKLEESEENVTLSIKDDGKGYAENIDAGKRTLGIMGMKERAAMIGGSYMIEGEPGKGTMVSVSVPHPQFSTIQNE